jgi:hypothetical protein
MLMLRLIAIMGLSGALAGCSNASISEQANAAAPTPAKASAAHPVVVELYQSQGCSSCPPANAALNAVADRPDVIALSFAVTYWDKLGWKDNFASPAFTQRQYDYATALGGSNVYTPQMVLNGVRDFTGIKTGELTRQIAASPAPAGGPSITSDGNRVQIGAGSGSAKVWLVRYDPRVQNVAIRAGENEGRTLPHKNIVRQLAPLGTWTGQAASFVLPKGNAALRSVILVQRGANGTGAIIAAQKL